MVELKARPVVVVAELVGPVVGFLEFRLLLPLWNPDIVAKKWDPGIMDPSRFLGQIRKVEARLGKLTKIRKVETN